MPEHPTPPGPPEDPGSSTSNTTTPDTTSVTIPGGGVTWYTAPPPPPPPPASGAGPSKRPGGRSRHIGRIAAVLALALAIFLAGGAVALHFASNDVSTTAMTQPAAPGATQQQPPASGYGYGNGNGYGYEQPSTGSNGRTGGTTTADAAAIAAKISPAIVNITVSNDITSSGGAATGIVLSSDGYVLTNNHVVNGSTDIKATDVGNGQTYTATVVGYDVSHDIALIKLEGASGLATAGIGDSASLAVGDVVVGVGNAGGDGGAPTVAAGTVVALDRQIVASDAGGSDAEQLSGLIQTDANIQSGDSGGPLVDAGGKVVGVMTAASATNGSYYGYGSGNEGYAVPIATALQVVDQIKSGQSSATVHIGETGFLGVQTTDAGAQGYGGGSYGYGYGYGDPYGYGSGSGGQSGAGGSGATVAGVVSGSPAAQAGLAAGDVITAVDGNAVASASALGDMIGAHHPGDKVTVTWTDSSGSQKSASVTLVQGPAK